MVRFNARGPGGLLDGKPVLSCAEGAPGKPAPLNTAQRQALVEIVESSPIPAIHGVVRWRRTPGSRSSTKLPTTPPTFLGGDVLATVLLEKVQGARAFYETIIRRGEDVLAEVKSGWCCIDAKTLRPVRLARDVITKFCPEADSSAHLA